jgi:hypothetical protein
LRKAIESEATPGRRKIGGPTGDGIECLIFLAKSPPEKLWKGENFGRNSFCESDITYD